MEKVIWHVEAEEDLIQIYNYISKDSIYYAELTVQNIIDLTNDLLLYPYMGRKVPELNNNKIRELIYKSYRVIYRVSNNCIYILRIYHHAMILISNFI